MIFQYLKTFGNHTIETIIHFVGTITKFIRTVSNFIRNHIYGTIIGTIVLGVIINLISTPISNRLFPPKTTTSEPSDIVDDNGSFISSKIITVNSELVNYIVISSPILLRGDTLTIKINTHSSKIRTFGLFEERKGKVAKVEGKYNSKNGGIYITYRIPLDVDFGYHKARIFVQEIGGMKEDKHSIQYEIINKDSLQNSQDTNLTIEELGFVFVDGGDLQMGSNDGYADERPVHNVQINSFWIMDHEFTIGELKKLRKRYPTLVINNIEEPDYIDNIVAIEVVDVDLLPATVTWNEARHVADKLGLFLDKTIRLPSEAEWEHAARGGLVGKDYIWGNKNEKINGQPVEELVTEIIGDLEHCRYSRIPVHPIKTLFPPNKYQLYDMAGNIWEWTSSAYKDYPYSKDDERENEGYSEFRIIRGGGNAPETCDIRVSFRGYGQKDSRYGVRFAMNN